MLLYKICRTNQPKLYFYRKISLRSPSKRMLQNIEKFVKITHEYVHINLDLKEDMDILIYWIDWENIFEFFPVSVTWAHCQMCTGGHISWKQTGHSSSFLWDKVTSYHNTSAWLTVSQMKCSIKSFKLGV